jgi:hypothetical protein
MIRRESFELLVCTVPNRPKRPSSAQTLLLNLPHVTLIIFVCRGGGVNAGMMGITRQEVWRVGVAVGAY